MVVLHQAGQTVAQIASRFGFHRTTVARHLKQAGRTLRTNPADPAFQERVREAYAEIGTVKHTAQRLGVSKDTVRKVVRGSEVTPNMAYRSARAIYRSIWKIANNHIVSLIR